eukprot:scaffold5393_cov129-Isochrysis_galbana.AAC.1
MSAPHRLGAARRRNAGDPGARSPACKVALLPMRTGFGVSPSCIYPQCWHAHKGDTRTPTATCASWRLRRGVTLRFARERG